MNGSADAETPKERGGYDPSMPSVPRAAPDRSGVVTRRLAGNVFWLGLAEGVPRIANFGIQLLLIRTFAPARYGIFGYAYALFALFIPAMNLGLPELLVREGARHRGDMTRIISRYASLKLLAGAVFVLVVAAVAASQPAVAGILFWVGIYLLLRSMTQFLAATFRALERMSGEFVIRTAEACFVLLACAILSTTSLPMSKFVAWLAAAAALAVTVVFFSLRRVFSGLAWSFDARDAIETLRQAIPFGLAAFLVQMYLRIDIVMLEHLVHDAAGVGYYASAVNFLLGVAIGPSIVAWALFPALSRRYRDLPGQKKGVYVGAALFALFGGGLALALVALVRPVVLHLFGARYLPAAPLAAALAPALVFLAPNLYLGVVVASLDGQRDLVWITASSAVLKLAANFWAIPVAGALGAARVTVLVEAVATVLYLVVVRKRLARQARLDSSGRLPDSVT
jgi:O-antigen/teichoic acid export membrane protein